jgi:hypothetical protein
MRDESAFAVLGATLGLAACAPRDYSIEISQRLELRRQVDRPGRRGF